jgi:uncharacterized cofD-like protein
MEQALKETSKVLAVTGEILPSTLEDVHLYARTHDQETVYGEHNITERGGRIRDVHIDPADAAAYPEAAEAILAADLIIAGPGSLFTSIIPNFLVPDIRSAFLDSRALKVYVCNVATQHGETDDYSVAEHYDALARHVGKPTAFDVVIANSNIGGTLPPNAHSVPVQPPKSMPDGVKLVLADVVSEENRYRHDSTKLAAAVLRLYDDGVGRDEAAEAAEFALVR